VFVTVEVSLAQLRKPPAGAKGRDKNLSKP